MKSFVCAVLAGVISAKIRPVDTAEYKNKSADAKNANIWYNVTTNTKSQDWYSAAQMAGLFTEYEDPTFTAMGDQMPAGQVYGIRDKLIHSVGTLG